MPTPSMKDGLVEVVLGRRGEGADTAELAKNSLEQLKLPAQGRFPSSTAENNEAKVVLSVGNDTVCAPTELDKLKRRRLSPRDDSSEQVLVVDEIEELPNSDFPRILHEVLTSPIQAERSSVMYLGSPKISSPSGTLWVKSPSASEKKAKKRQIFEADQLLQQPLTRGEMGGLVASELVSGSRITKPSLVNLSSVVVETPEAHLSGGLTVTLKRVLSGNESWLLDEEVSKIENCAPGAPELPRDSPEGGKGALKDPLESEDVQKYKKRRLVTPVDESHAWLPSKLGDNSKLRVTREINGMSYSKKSNFTGHVEGSGKDLVGCEIEYGQVSKARNLTGSGDYNSERSLIDVVNIKSDVQTDSSSTGGSPANTFDKGDLDHISQPDCYPDGPANPHIPRRKEWLAQHHGDNVETGIENPAYFAGNVGGCYRSAIDERPAAPHPGFVGDGSTVQCCRVCGQTEDATSSLICDSCEQVFHMSCVNSRMKIVPRVDEWLCRPCRKKRKMSRDCENQGDSDAGGEHKDWWRDDSGIGRIDRELLRMSNGRRMKVRIGSKYQADVPDWTGVVGGGLQNDIQNPDRFGREVAMTCEEKEVEQELAERNLAKFIWPRGWLPAIQLPPGYKENWLQCRNTLIEEGSVCPDGRKAEADIICGKWRRAPLGVQSNDSWECSCALVWDPRHADCAVPQELSTWEINERMKFTKASLPQ